MNEKVYDLQHKTRAEAEAYIDGWNTAYCTYSIRRIKTKKGKHFVVVRTEK